MPVDFNPKARCPKCDHVEVNAVYYPPLQSSVRVQGLVGQGVLVADAEWCNAHEHLLRRCWRCRFPWIERPLRSAITETPPPPPDGEAEAGYRRLDVCGQQGRRTRAGQNSNNPHVCTRAAGHKEIAHKCGTCGEDFLACVVCGRAVDEVKLDGRCTACWKGAPNIIPEGSPVLCEHANECPQTCPCEPGCYCKTHTCKPQIDAAPPAEPTREAVTIPVGGFARLIVERSRDGRVFLFVDFGTARKRGGFIPLGEATKLQQELCAAVAALRDKGHTE
jgi:hypothetical protein